MALRTSTSTLRRVAAVTLACLAVPATASAMTLGMGHTTKLMAVGPRVRLAAGQQASFSLVCPTRLVGVRVTYVGPVSVMIGWHPPVRLLSDEVVPSNAGVAVIATNIGIRAAYVQVRAYCRVI